MSISLANKLKASPPQTTMDAAAHGVFFFFDTAPLGRTRSLALKSMFTQSTDNPHVDSIYRLLKYATELKCLQNFCLKMIDQSHGQKAQ